MASTTSRSTLRRTSDSKRRRRSVTNISQCISTPSTGTESNYDSEIASFVSEKCDIIITVGFLMSDATWNAAVNNPTIHFAQVDNGDTSPGNDGIAIAPYTGTAPGNNILGLTYETQQDAFLGGYEAAAYAVLKNPKAPKVATYGGEQFSSVTSYMDGFYDGVQYYNSKNKKNVQVLGWNEKTQKGTFIGSFSDTATARADSVAFLARGRRPYSRSRAVTVSAPRRRYARGTRRTS